MLIASALWLIPPLLLEFQVLVDGMGAFVIFGDLYKNVLLVGLQKAQFGE